MRCRPGRSAERIPTARPARCAQTIAAPSRMWKPFDSEPSLWMTTVPSVRTPSTSKRISWIRAALSWSVNSGSGFGFRFGVRGSGSRFGVPSSGFEVRGSGFEVRGFLVRVRRRFGFSVLGPVQGSGSPCVLRSSAPNLNPEPRTWNPEPRTWNPDSRTWNPNPNPDPEPGTRN